MVLTLVPRRRNAKQCIFLFIAIGFLTFSCLAQESLSLTTTFPSVETVLEFANLSKIIYEVRSCKSKIIPDDVICHQYIEAKSRTQVMVVSNKSKKYVAVVYAGTDNADDWIHDLDIQLTPFGPEGNPIEKDIKVHKGFNHAVFGDNVYGRIHDTVSKFLEIHPDYDVVTTGHSLGAADSILTGAAFAKAMKHRNIVTYNFGCPRTGETQWKEYVDGITNLGVWRYVDRGDIVPRLPGFRFEHVGHTVQFNNHDAKAYYLHNGDDMLHYASVPPTWSTISFLDPFAFNDHLIRNYFDYIKKKSAKNPGKYWVDKFVSTDDKESAETFQEVQDKLDSSMHHISDYNGISKE